MYTFAFLKFSLFILLFYFPFFLVIFSEFHFTFYIYILVTSSWKILREQSSINRQSFFFFLQSFYEIFFLRYITIPLLSIFDIWNVFLFFESISIYILVVSRTIEIRSIYTSQQLHTRIRFNLIISIDAGKIIGQLD